jgi:hypothetical protein
MSGGWQGLFPVMGRLFVSAAALSGAIAILIRLRRPAVPGSAKRVEPTRSGRAELADAIRKSKERPFYRDNVAERLRALARDEDALGHGALDPRLADFLSRDFLVRSTYSQDFQDRVEEMLDTLERNHGDGERKSDAR